MRRRNRAYAKDHRRHHQTARALQKVNEINFIR
nr:MAG TPA: hypothetical protein [Caudoviricetes sp.]